MQTKHKEVSTIKFTSPLRSNRYQITIKTWLYSRSQQKEIETHQFSRQENEEIWYLTPGLYFTLTIYRSTWDIRVLRVNTDKTYTTEEPHYIPAWLIPLLPSEAQKVFDRDTK